MGDVAVKYTLISVSVVILASFISLILWTTIMGSKLEGDLENDLTAQYAHASESVMFSASTLESIDSVNLYKMLELNRSTIIDFSIRLLQPVNGSIYMSDWRQLIFDPDKRFNVKLKGDSGTGFIVDCQEVNA